MTPVIVWSPASTKNAGVGHRHISEIIKSVNPSFGIFLECVRIEQNVGRVVEGPGHLLDSFQPRGVATALELRDGWQRAAEPFGQLGECYSAVSPGQP